MEKTNSIHSSGSVLRERQEASSLLTIQWTVNPVTWTKWNFRPPCFLQKTAKSPQKGCNDPRQERRRGEQNGPRMHRVRTLLRLLELGDREHRFWQVGKEVNGGWRFLLLHRNSIYDYFPKSLRVSYSNTRVFGYFLSKNRKKLRSIGNSKEKS